MKKLFLLFFHLSYSFLFSQTDSISIKKNKDIEYIQEVENHISEKAKVLHAEPLYIDLIRDLGARKGEKEWNVGFGLVDKNNFDMYEGLIEYEWAPVDRLGVEVEIPFSIYSANKGGYSPANKINGLKLATQYTFLVDEKNATSLALGYIHEFETNSFSEMQNARFFTGNIFNPFFVAAKRWGNSFHTLLYTGPVIEQHFSNQSWHTSMQVNTNFHYMISGTRNFVGIEINKDFSKNDFSMILRPQIRLVINNKLMLGIVTGVPISKQNERYSSFLRLIYEPNH